MIGEKCKPFEWIESSPIKGEGGEAESETDAKANRQVFGGQLEW